MKKYIFACLIVLLLALFSLSGSIRADSADTRTLILSNELGSSGEGGLIDRLIAAGHGSKNLYEILQLLAAQPGSSIPADFVTSVGNNPAGSEVFTATLSNFAGLNGPVCINADGTLKIKPIFGRDYDGHTGYATTNATITGVARFNTVLATSSTYYIDAGAAPSGRYQAIGIVYTHAKLSLVLSNEAPGYLIDKLIANGHGSENLYQVLQFLAAKSGSGIPADFVTEVGNSPAGSDVFMAALSIFADPSNNPIVINADGTLHVVSIYGRDYDGKTGYVTNNTPYSGIGQAKTTMATSPAYYIDAGSGGGDGTFIYYAIGIAWAGATTPPAAPTGLTVE